ncbi:urate oxidase [Streptoalloteichus tenebrarius]|uniref:Uricase n=1 Tax=Streptoalloteichus tenebrarius (strain ATCC 17920 / DSM 40477 / JCM 4838 / CBS 697.72 / NBRC 16177 / NCIMB 11028 / NRRL B-12390 / A12253. 1 / ISP 5477) TaxID=1933 RepID=A0ABT1I2H4_STRSD|nr:urate oxidase [Streptoalloteichus tenebrarius]MCP2261770.1 urate oxidase [Streptoalloteichus tenebrarius]BFF00827.1 urate oxidase [Streptoalloteichus tenebrarius]
MSIVLGDNQYGKAETRVVRIDRDAEAHRVTDLNVSVALSGDMTDTHLTGANDKVLPTDTQKNTVYVFARDGVGEIEEFGLRLARHFVDSQPTVGRARVRIEQYPWTRLELEGAPAHHSFARSGEGTRTAVVTYDGRQAWVVSGITDLVVLNSTGSEFWGFLKDRYTTLQETRDRILATAVNATWRHEGAEDTDWGKSYATARRALLDAFAETYSLSLQQTLYAMGERVLRTCPEIVEVRLSLPNKHHFLVDLAPFGLDNPNEVFHAADRPYGLIEGSVLRDDAPPAGMAW